MSTAIENKQKIRNETISFELTDELAGVDSVFSGCRYDKDNIIIDLVDFETKTLNRWFIPKPDVSSAVSLLKSEITNEQLPWGISTHEEYLDNMMQPHVAQVSKDRSKLLVCLGGGIYNGLCCYMIDTAENSVEIFPDNFRDKLMLYSATGDFMPDETHWAFVRWPLKDAVDIYLKKKDTTNCQIGIVDIKSFETEILFEIENTDRIHQITCSPDGRYFVFTPFTMDLNIPYPRTPYREDMPGYNKSHKGGIRKSTMVTLDLEKHKMWRTEIPVPVPAHFEFDPVDPHVFYVSAHNFCSWGNKLIIEDPAAVFKMRIHESETRIESFYTEETFYRGTQHVPFMFNGKTLIAVTICPNRLDILDATDMSLWRSIELFTADTIDRSKTGNVVCPSYSESCYSVNPSSDGRYLVLESGRSFNIYDLEKDLLHKNAVSRYIPNGCCGIGHTRSLGA